MVAKFNYEITYLVSTAYVEILKKETTWNFRYLKILDTYFLCRQCDKENFKNFVLISSQSLNESYVSRNKMEAVMNVI